MSRNRIRIALRGAALAAALTGCGQQTPEQTQADVTQATTAGVRAVANEQNRATDRMVAARKDVTKTQLELSQDGATTARAVAIAEAQSAHNVSLARCEGVPNAARNACESSADAVLAAAKATADATLAPNSQQP